MDKSAINLDILCDVSELNVSNIVYSQVINNTQPVYKLQYFYAPTSIVFIYMIINTLCLSHNLFFNLSA